MTSKRFKKSQKVRCFNCGNKDHLKRDCRQGVPRNNVFSIDNPNRRLQPSRVCRSCGKGQHWTKECRSIRNRQGKPLPSGNALRGLPQVPISNFAQ